MSQITIPIDIVNIEDEGFHLLVRGSINDLNAVFILDTGASRTVLDLGSLHLFQIYEPAHRSDVHSTGLGISELESFYLESVRIRLFEILMHTEFVTVINLQHVHDAYKRLGLPRIAGIIGSDLLVKHKAVIDFAKATLTVSEL